MGLLLLGNQEQVWNSHGKWAINVRATEVLLYLVNIRPGRRDPLQNNHKSLDLFCKTDLDFCGCFGREKYPTAELVQLINLSRVILKEKIPSYSQINTVPSLPLTSD